MIWIITIIVAALVLGWGWFSSSLVVRLQRYPVQILPAAFGLPFEDVEFTTEDGLRLAGWFVPAKVPSDTTIVLCHGWGANRSDILPATVFLNRSGGYNLFYFDFRNHGDSAGERSSVGALEGRDLEAALKFLRERKPERARRLGLYGLSLGGAVALAGAARHPEVEGVVAESAFSSYSEVVARFAKMFYGVPRPLFVPATLFFVRLRLGLDPETASPIRCIDKISPRPVFLIQGDADERMPVSEGEALFARAKEPKTLWTVKGADHGKAAELAGPEYEERMLKFYREAFSGEVKGEK